jgi:2-alkyl-3-oxoalkanoate reductase
MRTWLPGAPCVADRGVVAVTGASGFIGSRLTSVLRDRGWTVRALVRRPPVAPVVGIDYRTWELGAPAVEAVAGAMVLVHAAAVPYDVPDAHDLNLAGSARLIDEARRAGVGRVVFLSSMSAREDTPSTYGRDKARVAASLVPTDLVIRPGLVLGGGGLFGRIADLVGRRRVVPLVGGRQRFQTIHVDDLVEAVARALDLDMSGTITVAERHPVEFRVLLAELATRLGRHPLFVPVPYRLVGAAIGAARFLRMNLPVSDENLAGLRALRSAPVDADLVRLAFEPRDYRASLRDLFPGA